MSKHIASLLALSVALLGCGARTEPEIIADTYPPEVGPVIPPPHQGGPDELVWISEPTIGISSVAGQWKYNSIGVASASDNQPGYLMLPLSPENGSRLRCVRATVLGPTGHQKLPETPASIAVTRFDLDSAGPLVIMTGSDQSKDLDAYEHVHQIEACADEDEIVDLSKYRYMAGVDNEHGFDTLPGLKVVGVRRGVAPPP